MGDASDKRHQPVLRRPLWRSLYQGRLRHAFPNQAMHAASQAFDCPVMSFAIEDAHDIVPAVVRPQPAYRRQPCLGGGNQIVDIGALARGGDRPDGFRPTFAQAGVAGQPAPRLGSLHPCLGALGDQRALQLGDGAENLQRKHPLRGRRIDRVAQRAEMHAALLQLLDDLEQMADRSGEAVETHDDEDIAGGDLAQQLCQHRAGARSAGSVLLMDDTAAGGLQFVDLGVVGLILGRNMR